MPHGVFRDTPLLIQETIWKAALIASLATFCHTTSVDRCAGEHSKQSSALSRCQPRPLTTHRAHHPLAPPDCCSPSQSDTCTGRITVTLGRNREWTGDPGEATANSQQGDHKWDLHFHQFQESSKTPSLNLQHLYINLRRSCDCLCGGVPSFIRSCVVAGFIQFALGNTIPLKKSHLFGFSVSNRWSQCDRLACLRLDSRYSISLFDRNHLIYDPSPLFCLHGNSFQYAHVR